MLVGVVWIYDHTVTLCNARHVDIDRNMMYIMYVHLGEDHHGDHHFTCRAVLARDWPDHQDS